MQDVKLVHMHVEGAGPHMHPSVQKAFRAVNLFTGANGRKAVNEGRADFVPIFLSDVRGASDNADDNHNNHSC